MTTLFIANNTHSAQLDTYIIGYLRTLTENWVTSLSGNRPVANYVDTFRPIFERFSMKLDDDNAVDYLRAFCVPLIRTKGEVFVNFARWHAVEEAPASRASKIHEAVTSLPITGSVSTPWSNIDAYMLEIETYVNKRKLDKNISKLDISAIARDVGKVPEGTNLLQLLKQAGYKIFNYEDAPDRFFVDFAENVRKNAIYV